MLWSIVRCLLYGFLLAEIASLVTTVYLHRGGAHRSVTFHPAVRFVLGFLLWATTGIRLKEWAAVHLKHHKHADQPGDPHSPLILGFWKVQLGNVYLYQRALRDPDIMRYARHVELTWVEENVFSVPNVGLASGIAALCLVFGFGEGLGIAAVHTVLYVFVLNSLVNGWCHFRGYKNYPDVVAFNNRFIAWLTGGEGLHNNHHEDQRNPSLRRSRPVGRFGEVDLGFLLIRLLSGLGLAETKKA